MRRFLRVPVLAFGFIAFSSKEVTMASLAMAQTPVPTLSEIIVKVQSNVRVSVKSRGELDCREKRAYLSSFNGSTSFIWSAELDIVRTSAGPFRKVISVEGRAPQNWLQQGDSPFGNEELFGTAEHVFSAPYSDGRSFKLSGSETLNGRSMFVLEFEAKPPNFTREYGKAWIDKETFQVPRIEVHAINNGFNPFTTAEYAGVTIDGKPFWLPTKRTIETNSTRTTTDGRKTLEVTELSNCRRFEVSVTVRPVP
ncbi:MAG TPA: hypothetical protein VFO86_12825 [Terriglobia bacterium]|nr:hypothetical protein [Terriglobia bacterium]